MILEIMDFNLTPQRSNFDGSGWYVQGQRNERVGATAHYVYSAHNLSSSTRPTIPFRRRINPEEQVSRKAISSNHLLHQKFMAQKMVMP